MIRSCLVAAAVLSLAGGAHAASLNAPIGKGAPDDGPGVAMGATNCVGGFAGVYPCNNVDLMAFMPIATIGGGGGSDIWGWTDPVTGHEWAILGRSNGTAFVDITDPANPDLRGEPADAHRARRPGARSRRTATTSTSSPT